MIDTLVFLVYFGYYVFIFTLAWVLVSEWELVAKLPKIQLQMLFGGLCVSGIAGALLWFFR